MTVIVNGKSHSEPIHSLFIILSITDYERTPHRLLLHALLHHVVPSSLKVWPTREGQRSAQIPGCPLTVAVECSGWFIASGSNCTCIWQSFEAINPPAGLLLAHTTMQHLCTFHSLVTSNHMRISTFCLYSQISSVYFQITKSSTTLLKLHSFIVRVRRHHELVKVPFLSLCPF